ncbi:tRNA-modifying protein YgfZ [Vibrio sp. SCSIO 43136]|uniref:tRNA-modifying protein YgfZ n=1 Tax=Vibrio sp. SCSIO 43136 TaxID=2819101 RepID=UPI002075495A|nr:tRNA-modifying protein YgfZ [Vibrio sp. SCSIO 43136]USD65646.1 tRNA-modifying protein YgfZ [Vibrio sp. SCSIO 43136]
MQPTVSLPLAANAPLPTLSVSVLDNWSLITVNGDDRKSYLQGQVTCDVVALNNDQTTFGAHCDAKGKVWNVFQLFHHQQGYALVQRQSATEVALRELKKYAVFSKVEIETSEQTLLGVFGEQGAQWLNQWFDTSVDVSHSEAGTAVKIADQRWLVAAASETSANALMQDAPELSDDKLWDLLDIQTGRPRCEESLQTQHIPQAFNLQAIGGISFSKGCYTGQEMVARAKYRGMNKRAMFRVSGSFNDQMPEQATLERAVGDNWRSAGDLMAQFAFSDQKACGLIILPNDIEPETQLRLAEQPDQIWAIEPLPYSLEDE